MVGVTTSGSWSLSPKSSVDLPALSRPSSKMVMFFSFRFLYHRKRFPASVNILCGRALPPIQTRSPARRPRVRPVLAPAEARTVMHHLLRRRAPAPASAQRRVSRPVPTPSPLHSSLERVLPFVRLPLQPRSRFQNSAFGSEIANGFLSD
jgi:hypothetical protein